MLPPHVREASGVPEARMVRIRSSTVSFSATEVRRRAMVSRQTRSNVAPQGFIPPHSSPLLAHMATRCIGDRGAASVIAYYASQPPCSDGQGSREESCQLEAVGERKIQQQNA